MASRLPQGGMVSVTGVPGAEMPVVYPPPGAIPPEVSGEGAACGASEGATFNIKTEPLGGVFPIDPAEALGNSAARFAESPAQSVAALVEAPASEGEADSRFTAFFDNVRYLNLSKNFGLLRNEIKKYSPAELHAFQNILTKKILASDQDAEKYSIIYQNITDYFLNYPVKAENLVRLVTLILHIRPADLAACPYAKALLEPLIRITQTHSYCVDSCKSGLDIKTDAGRLELAKRLKANPFIKVLEQMAKEKNGDALLPKSLVTYARALHDIQSAQAYRLCAVLLDALNVLHPFETDPETIAGCEDLARSPIEVCRQEPSLSKQTKQCGREIRVSTHFCHLCHPSGPQITFSK